MNQNKNKQKVVFSWEGPDHIKYQKGKLWYMIAFLVAILFFTWALFENSIPMMISTICAVIAYYLYDQKMPNSVQISISQFGVQVGERLVPFSDLKSFRIDYHPPVCILSLQPKSAWGHDLSVLFPEQLPPEDLRQFMLTQLPEQKPEDKSLIDAILKTFRI